MTSSASPVRRATPGDLPRLVEVLSAAFDHDPVFVHLLPLDVPRRAERVRRFFALDLPRRVAEGGAWTTADGAGAAIWHPPGRWRASVWQSLRETPSMLRVFGRQARVAGQVRDHMNAHHPGDPHWYLLYLGVEPGRQGQGVGAALLRGQLEECDRDRVPAYLEASNDRNRALYLRHGFADRPELTLPSGGPVLRPMWRKPVEPAVGP